MSFYISDTSFYTRNAAGIWPDLTFGTLFHQTDNVMHIHLIVLLCFSQSFVACQNDSENARSLAANFGLESVAATLPTPEKKQPSSTGIVFQSTDGGQTWQDASAGLPDDFQAYTMLNRDGEIVMGSETGLFRSTKPPVAEAWEKDFFSGERITSIFPGRDGLYLCNYGTGVFQKMAGGGICLPMFTTLKDPTIHAVLETPNGNVLVGSDNGIFKSADSGKSWKHVFEEGMVLSLVAADGMLLAGGFRGLMRSTDGGEHWDWVLTEDGTASKIGQIDGRFVAITNAGVSPENGNQTPEDYGNRLRISADGGKTWQRIGEGLSQGRFSYWMGKYLGPVRLINDVVQVGKALFCSTEVGIFRSADQGHTWKVVFHAPDKQSLRLVVSGGIIYVVTGAGC